MVPTNIESRKHVESLALNQALSSYTASELTSCLVSIQSILKDCVVGRHNVAIMPHSYCCIISRLLRIFCLLELCSQLRILREALKGNSNLQDLLRDSDTVYLQFC